MKKERYNKFFESTAAESWKQFLKKLDHKPTLEEVQAWIEINKKLFYNIGPGGLPNRGEYEIFFADDLITPIIQWGADEEDEEGEQVNYEITFPSKYNKDFLMNTFN